MAGDIIAEYPKLPALGGGTWEEVGGGAPLPLFLPLPPCAPLKRAISRH